MIEAKNEVRIEGILSEVDLKYGSFTKKTGQKVNSIGGIIKIQVNQNINDKEIMLEIPVHMFASELTNKGTKNPAYQNIEKIKDEYVSIAAAGSVQGADRVSISSGKITENAFPGRNGETVSYPRVTASFVNKVSPERFEPKASFEVNFVVAKKIPEVDSEGIETGRYKVTGILPQYGGRVDVIDFIAENPKVVSGIEQVWNENDTVRAAGRLNFTSHTETVIKEPDFGEPQKIVRTYSVSELIMTGIDNPFDGDLAYDLTEIKEALTERAARLEKLKADSLNKNKTRNAPVADSKGRIDLGF